MLGHELAVLAPERFAKADRGVAAEVREPFAFLLAHVIVVGLAGASDRRPPLLAAEFGRVGVADPVADVVVVTDGVEGFALGVLATPFEQLG